MDNSYQDNDGLDSLKELINDVFRGKTLPIEDDYEDEEDEFYLELDEKDSYLNQFLLDAWPSIIKSIEALDKKLFYFLDEAIFLAVNDDEVVIGFPGNLLDIDVIFEDDDKMDLLSDSIDEYMGEGFGIKFIEVIDEEYE